MAQLGPVQFCPPCPQPGLSFTQGLLLGQLSVILVIGCFIKFFIFGEVPISSDSPKTPSIPPTHKRKPSYTKSPSRPTSGSSIRGIPPLTPATILSKTLYNVNAHQPESLDWFNVLIAQTIAQFRTDALADNAILTSLTTVLNGPHKPDFLTDIAVTEISLGEDFPIFSNCRVHPVADDDGLGQGRLQARMDVDLSDFITLGVETTMVLNYPRPRTAVLPVALSVSVVRFSGTLAISFLPASVNVAPTKNGKDGNGNPIPSQSRTPTSLAFSFMPNYTLSLSTRSLLGARSRLQDVPKIAQLVENRLRTWFEERCVQPRMQQVVVPSLWPRMKNVVEEGEGKDTEAAIDSIENSARAASTSRREAEAEFGNIVSGMTPERRGRGDLGEGLRRRVDQRTSERGRELGVSSQLPGPMPGTLVS